MSEVMLQDNTYYVNLFDKDGNSVPPPEGKTNVTSFKSLDENLDRIAKKENLEESWKAGVISDLFLFGEAELKGQNGEKLLVRIRSGFCMVTPSNYETYVAEEESQPDA